ncbi:ATP-binding cassette domain-containing protein [Streptomyces rapamycinicus]|uniref:ABC transporter ATP-binding protein n=2 Tax=Streptomyces rapamycinicus TaxID=1226757 RepID=A0A0A0NQS6_STRRN|nr:ATP-binding cassette domain-containing protein [Streptomyces rapamycinicus]AGP58578.1 ABC transporter ATP-binding protein [Streptomyces rapamycinicus NRRL 5491]MBB4786287.1 ABC-type multidrug transport system ATPase subunit [Streptomyces rapamycinicus]RLV78252.1 ABC transporter ATP-binding protein [Streptomyces rapamycinicus NRRL 5491]UTO66387.1 ATP-binding cassette domain-containing protein [Streptomyces rapamycinicus]UTP34341.1 ATP-binding cassette domain-containing protein [Streptomyces 
MGGTPEAETGAAVTAEGLGVRGSHGWAFRGADITADPGALIAVEGPSGSGRTSLLLTLTGRMRPTEGHGGVGGFRVPQQMARIRRISALAHVPGVTELDPVLTVAEHLRERAMLRRRFADSPRGLLRPRRERAAASRAAIDAALTAAGLDLDTLPKGPRTAVRDLERLEALRLSIALALISRPRLLAVDDADLKLSDDDRERAWALLREIAEDGTTVLAVCSQAPPGAVVVRTARTSAAENGESGENGEKARRTQQADAPAAEGHEHDENEEGSADALAETRRA